MQTITFAELLRSLKQNMDSPHSMLLGAGASVESGVPSASDCIWDWKKEIFLSHNPTMIESCSNTKIENVRIAIQKWLDSKREYPAADSSEEYSFYAEKSLPIEDDRRKYFQHLADGKSPSLGYHLISMFSEIGWIKSVWTTNFDGLMVKCAHNYNLTPIEITCDTSDRIYRGDTDRELLCISLHGDYKYGNLKNTTTELDSQNATFVSALSHAFSNRNLIVIGYSGRDKSLMDALEKAYQTKGSGRLYWCGYGQNANNDVARLIDFINTNGRSAYYVPTDGFDNTLYGIAHHCLSDNKTIIANVETLKKKLGGSVDSGTAPFDIVTAIADKVVGTNAYLISFPKTCYQFQVEYLDDEKPWDYCKLLMANGIMAVPYRKFIYAWGISEKIHEICGSKLKSEVVHTPFTKALLEKTGSFQELLRKTLVAIIGQTALLQYSKEKVWDTNKIIRRNFSGRVISAYTGIKISLFFDTNHTYVTFSPSFVFEKDMVLSREENKQFADAFHAEINNKQPNLNVEKYITKWARLLLGDKGIRAKFPLGSNTSFNFAFGVSSALLGVNCGQPYSVRLPDTINSKRMVLHGVECRDPELEFYNSHQKALVTDFHPMRGLENNAPIDYAINENVLRSTISLGVICPQSSAKVFQDFIAGLQNRYIVNYNAEFVTPFPSFYNAFKTGLTIPTSNANTWLDVCAPANRDIKQASVEFGRSITQKLDQLSSMQTDVAIIYIPKEFEPLTGFSDEYEKYDLHDFVKAYAVQKNIATQFIREKTLDDKKMYCQIMWALSLAIYVKSCRIPWTISGIQKDTAFAGIGYSVNHSENGSQIIVGCSHIYSADGQGMKYKLAKINECTFDRKNNPYLTENEAYRLGLNIKELFYKSFTELPKRVVIHKRTPFKQEEIKGLKESLFSAGITDLELLEISYEDNLRCFAYDKNNTNIDGFPVWRGLCYPINERTLHLFTHGIAPSVRNPNYKYIQGGKSIPLPLRIVKHYGIGTMDQIATEILGLSKMNWNSFGLYSKLPCTIESSNEIARIGWLLSHYEGVVYDYRFFM